MIIPCTIFVVFGIIIRRFLNIINKSTRKSLKTCPTSWNASFIGQCDPVRILIPCSHILSCSIACTSQFIWLNRQYYLSQIKKTRVLFCTNIRQWFIYGPKVHLSIPTEWFLIRRSIQQLFSYLLIWNRMIWESLSGDSPFYLNLWFSLFVHWNT